jgi:hypothetical protein
VQSGAWPKLPSCPLPSKVSVCSRDSASISGSIQTKRAFGSNGVGIGVSVTGLGVIYHRPVQEVPIRKRHKSQVETPFRATSRAELCPVRAPAALALPGPDQLRDGKMPTIAMQKVITRTGGKIANGTLPPVLPIVSPPKAVFGAVPDG